MKALFGLVALLGYVAGVATLSWAPTVFQESLAFLIITNANLFLIASLWPDKRRLEIGSGEIGGLEFDVFDDGTVTLFDKKRGRTRFPSIEMLERTLREHTGDGPALPFSYEGWGTSTPAEQSATAKRGWFSKATA